MLANLRGFSNPDLAVNVAFNAPVVLDTPQTRIAYAKNVLGYNEEDRKQTLMSAMISQPEEYLKARNKHAKEASDQAADTFSTLYAKLLEKTTIGTTEIPAMPESVARALALEAADSVKRYMNAAIEVEEPASFGNVALELKATSNNALNNAKRAGVQKALQIGKK
jgi:hypothetical protein